MTIYHNYPLKPYNTFGLDVRTAAYLRVTTLEELREALRTGQDFTRVVVLGGGSNLLLTGDIEGLVIHIAIKGKNIVQETASIVDIECAAGEVWDDIVWYAVEQNWCGIENLSLIPGSVGASPVQNIGAYGVELKDVLVSVQGLMRDTGELHTFTNAECCFGYRDSVFKRDLKEKFVITSITVRLRKNPTPTDLKTSYGTIREELQRLKPESTTDTYTIADVSEAVRRIRRSKLPDPAEIGNAGSFFKNPEVTEETYQRLYATFPQMPAFKQDSGRVKIPAGWLIEQAGWKGRREGDAGMHTQQALVLVNYGTATGRDLVSLSEKVRASVKEKFGVVLETEVNIL